VREVCIRGGHGPLNRIQGRAMRECLAGPRCSNQIPVRYLISMAEFSAPFTVFLLELSGSNTQSVPFTRNL
jgi:hypothetical protein